MHRGRAVSPSRAVLSRAVLQFRTLVYGALLLVASTASIAGVNRALGPALAFAGALVIPAFAAKAAKTSTL